ncbi:diguanylate cyclase [Heliobacterium undosum]|uniref:Diguanylate cyclase n=1 Tax=Heliomicrobium undosum TaxID=121734 RepID=A0A845LEN0_9FIRM|nr:diguanylate cyclase [Heliomicrobium undosum]MZP31381.1 diguanylate cyclase [Heliomicrobium undosum]
MISLCIVAVISFASYANVFSTQTEKRLNELKTDVAERVRTDSEIFRLAEDNLKVFEKEFMQLYLSDAKVTKEEFWSCYFVDAQGATRMKREYFDGLYGKDGNYIYGMSSFIGNNQRVDDPDFQRRLVLANRVLTRLGPAWVNRFANVHVAFPENAITLFYPEEPWGLNARADLPMNELGVIGAVSKQKNPERRSIWSGLYFDETAKKWMITYMDPVDYDGRHLITPGHDLYLTDLMERLVESSNDGTYNFIIRKDGYLVAHPSNPSDAQKWVGQLSLDKIDIPSVKEAYQRIREEIKDETAEVRIIQNKTHDSYLAVGMIRGPEWYFVRVLPVAKIRDAAHQEARRVFVEGMTVLFAVLLVVYSVMRYQAEKPLQQLTHAAEVIGSGEYGEVAEGRIPLPVQLNNEIGLLSTRFVEMAGSVKDAKENLERIVEERTQALEKANADLMEMSLLDGLTGIHNRRSFDRSLAHIFSDAKQGLGTFSVMMLDIDYFKSYNDTYGHAEGDGALKAIAAAIKGTIREEDRCFRYGGEEFVVIFNDANATAAEGIAERIIQSVHRLGIAHSESPYGIITVSGGIAEYDDAYAKPEEIVKAADQKLYIAKNKGRNRIAL